MYDNGLAVNVLEDPTSKIVTSDILCLQHTGGLLCAILSVLTIAIVRHRHYKANYFIQPENYLSLGES